MEIQFHDANMLSRSLFYLSRYAVAGCAVLAPDEPFMSLSSMADAYKNGLLLIKIAGRLEHTDPERILVYGEGAGAAQFL